jgi:hypothetical protein
VQMQMDPFLFQCLLSDQMSKKIWWKLNEARGEGRDLEVEVEDYGEITHTMH